MPARPICFYSSCTGTAKVSCTIKRKRIIWLTVHRMWRACARVCPSNIPLVQYFRQEKAEIYAISMEENALPKRKSL